MACSSQRLLLAALMSVLALHLCSVSEASGNFDCCLQYTVHVIPFRHLRGFTQQWANEACDINAVILITKRGFSVCADPRKTWVKKAVRMLSRKAIKI